MSEVKRLTDHELQVMQMIKRDSLEAANNLGEIVYQNTVIEDQISKIKSQVIAIKKREDEFIQELREKYGNVTINIDTGEIE